MRIVLRKTVLCIIVFMLIVSLSEKVFARRDISQDNLKISVLITLKNGLKSSGFYLNHKEESLYLVTARHVLFEKDRKASEFTLKSNEVLLLSYSKEGEIGDPIELEVSLDLLYKMGFVKFHSSGDVVIVKIGIAKERDGAFTLIKGVKIKKVPKNFNNGNHFIFINTKNIKEYKDVLISNEVYIFGYPVSLGLKNMPQLDYDKPLLRKGIIAGKNDKKQTLILDCPVYYGNSGGPVIQLEQTSLTSSEVRLIGVVSQFIPFEEEWYNVKHKYRNVEIENSGYSVITPMDFVLDLIGEHNSR